MGNNIKHIFNLTSHLKCWWNGEKAWQVRLRLRRHWWGHWINRCHMTKCRNFMIYSLQIGSHGNHLFNVPISASQASLSFVLLSRHLININSTVLYLLTFSHRISVDSTIFPLHDKMSRSLPTPPIMNHPLYCSIYIVTTHLQCWFTVYCNPSSCYHTLWSPM